MSSQLPSPPRCIVVGMPRAGTTFLFYYLSQHPDLFAPARKEVNYYSVFFERGSDWYNGLYQEISPTQLGLDASPFYYLDSRSVKRISEHEPDSKIILGLRKPSEMVCSMYERIASSTLNMPTFSSFIEGFHWDIGSGLSLQLREFPFIERVREFQELFGDRLLIYNFEELHQDPLGLLNTVEGHLQIRHHFTSNNFNNRVINASNRRNNKVISAYLKNEKLIDALIKMVPRKLINESRAWFLKASRAQTSPGEIKLPEENLEIARKYLKKEDELISGLFESSNFLTGSGSVMSKSGAS